MNFPVLKFVLTFDRILGQSLVIEKVV